MHRVTLERGAAQVTVTISPETGWEEQGQHREGIQRIWHEQRRPRKKPP